MTRPGKRPGLDENADVFGAAVRERLEVAFGERGEVLDSFVTVRELIAALRSVGLTITVRNLGR